MLPGFWTLSIRGVNEHAVIMFSIIFFFSLFAGMTFCQNDFVLSYWEGNKRKDFLR